jgi:hypothetical protein
MSSIDRIPQNASSAAPAGARAPRRRRRTGFVVAGVAAAGLVLGVAGAGFATAAPAQASGLERTAVTGELRAAAEELRAADPAERPALAEDILERGLDGAYGERAQQVAERVQERLEPLPDELTDELFGLLALPMDERRAEIRGILERAQAGEYGEEVQSEVERFGPGGRGAFATPSSSDA